MPAVMSGSLGIALLFDRDISDFVVTGHEQYNFLVFDMKEEIPGQK
jgi:hypothetical protein